ncbi:MAG: hypothetical protein U9M97_03895 [Candidatus Hadarchaeota archaeon]|nr:hypothetical protein [Candidatus Hadarchaeota archaeon]
MQQILEELKNGNTKIVSFFVESDKKWAELLSDVDALNVDDLAKKLGAAQFEFERICGGDRYLGKTIMGWSGFAHLYSCQVGFEENGPRAYKLAQAFEKSMCSLEVKFAAKRAAKEYSVNDFA